MNEKIQATINALMTQRNQALDAVAVLQGEIAERDMRIDTLQKALVELEKKPELKAVP